MLHFVKVKSCEHTNAMLLVQGPPIIGQNRTGWSLEECKVSRDPRIFEPRVTCSDQLKISGVLLALNIWKNKLTLSSSGSWGLITEEPSCGETSVSPNDLGG